MTNSDPARLIELAYVDDVVNEFIAVAEQNDRRSPMSGETLWGAVPPTYQISLGDLENRIRSFRAHRENLLVPDFSDRFNKNLYAAYLSYLDASDLAYGLKVKKDERGCLAEFLKSSAVGQIFVSRTRPGITRGNHYHNTKTEKFLVLEGNALIRLRSISENDVLEFTVDGREFCVVDIPPGYTHSIENLGSSDLITVFWASEIFDAGRPDTNWLTVLPT